ncbi:MBL fold metallo-hydrolase [Sphingomonas sp. KRR8]|uniref:MBL fold metallo-hydrolase n=1 Tax=Sphingomonas sp. KRR8 TaxID=2942996 RepID=UPI00201FD371|nr:MBL fold metallo-hydrolase [Sphingomonas sp. KRR8]URD60784.1 MBL fold metallo-hydrolase [Sphingomonas sp. KRR8]
MPKNPYYAGPASDHFDGLRFFNPGEEAPDRGFRDILKWRRTSVVAPWPESVPVTPARPQARVEGLAITMVGHATLLIQSAGLNVLTDPVWSERASPLSFAGPKRVTVPGIRFDDLPPIDAVLLSHNHYDHLDVATLRRLRRTHDPLFLMPLGNDAIVGKAVAGARIRVGDWGERLAIGERHSTTLTRANHWSARGVRDRRMALWAGHWLDTPAGSVWFAADTGYGTGAIFREIRQRHGRPDVALLPIGAYEPRWFMAPQHVNPAEAVRIAADVEAKAALGIHWGTFQLTDEAREAPLVALADALNAQNMARERFQAAEPGQIYRF